MKQIIKKGNQVLILCGKDKGKKGKIVKVIPDIRKVIVADINKYKKHQKPGNNEPGGIVDKDMPLHISNVAFFDSQNNKGVRVGYSLNKEGKNFVGRAKVLDTPNGKIVKCLIDEGARLGVSSRGMGTLKPENKGQIVQKDFYLATAADIVADPSAPNAFVEGIMEGREWIWDNGLLREQDVERARDNIRSASSRELEEVKLSEFKNLLSKL